MRSGRRGIFQRKSRKLPIGAYRAAVLCEQVIGTVGVKCSDFSRSRRIRAIPKWEQDDDPKTTASQGLAQRRRRALQLHLAEFTQEGIADKLGVARPVVCRDLQSARDAWRSGDSPDLEEARFTQMAKMKFSPQGLEFDSRHPSMEGTFRPEEAAASWYERRIYDHIFDGYCTQLRL